MKAWSSVKLGELFEQIDRMSCVDHDASYHLFGGASKEMARSFVKQPIYGQRWFSGQHHSGLRVVSRW